MSWIAGETVRKQVNFDCQVENDLKALLDYYSFDKANQLWVEPRFHYALDKIRKSHFRSPQLVNPVRYFAATITLLIC